MRESHRRWLRREVPTWIEAGWIAPGPADRLLERYGAAGPGQGRRWAVLLFSVLGAALIGLGLIMVLGHNWDQLSRGARAAVAFVPLAAAQALAGWAHGSGRRNAAWREGTGTLLALAVGATLGLISQTYQVGGTWQDFVLTWMLLVLPVCYLLRASVPAMLYLAGLTAWLMGAGETAARFAYWPMLAAVLPCLARAARTRAAAPGAAFPFWILALCLPVALGFTLQDALESLWLPAYSGLAAILFLAGAGGDDEAAPAWRRPFFLVGAFGVLQMAFLWTFGEILRETARQHWLAGVSPIRLDTLVPLALTAALVLGAAGLLARTVRRRAWGLALYGALPLAALLVHALSLRRSPLVTVLANGYVLALALVPLVSGLRLGRLGRVNAGLLLLSALVLARFFDSALGLLVKGLVFMGAGLAFLVINLALLRRKGASP